MADFFKEDSPVADALWWSDMTTGPDGQLMSAEKRLAEIRARYGPSDVVGRFIDEAELDLLAAVRRTERRLEFV
ncbi:MAG: hypothetical protein WKH64_16450 [Chloroflexia bacterium]